MREFAGRVSVITGAGAGIGRALALELAGRGASLALSDVDAAAVARTAADCSALGVRAIPYELDVSARGRRCSPMRMLWCRSSAPSTS